MFVGKDHFLELHSGEKQVATPCLDDHQVLPEDYGTTGELSTVCVHIVQKMWVFVKNWTTLFSNTVSWLILWNDQ